MTLDERISDDMKNAMKAKDVLLLSTLRGVRSAIQNQQIALGHELSELEVLSVLEKQAKQRRDSIEQYRAGKRDDLADREAKELLVIDSYLPKKLDNDALSVLVDAAVAETGAEGPADMGKVIKAVMEKAAGAADGKSVSDMVRTKLGNV